MVKRKGSEKEREIAEALGFIKSMKQSAPAENEIIQEFLVEKERSLFEELFNCCFEKFNDGKEGI